MASAYNRSQYKRNRLLVLEAAGWRCEWPGCGRPAGTADHILPVSRGGTSDVWNLRASCARCNSQGGVALVNEAKQARRIGRRSRAW
jgi:5-methylcytosine-specific restriction endonuclease McrA